jgi:pyruvate/2-oxoglutarate/acetoin dehydrogenase E1 component
MEWLGKKDDTIFLGQAVKYTGNAMYNTTKTISDDKKIEVPVFEDVQMMLSMGMALEGFVPITCYPRFDFLISLSTKFTLDLYQNLELLLFKFGINLM